MYEDISNTIKIRSCCNWYEFGEQSNKYFLTLEKNWACQNIRHKICSKTQEIADFAKVNSANFDFCANVFHEKLEANSESLNSF